MAEAATAARPATAAAPANTGLALAPAELSSDNLRKLGYDIVGVSNDIRKLNRDLTQSIGVGVFRHNRDAEAVIRKGFEDAMTKVFGPQGIIARGEAFMNGKTEKGEPASGISTAVTGKDNVVYSANVRTLVDALTGSQENRNLRNAVVRAASNNN